MIVLGQSDAEKQTLMEKISSQKGERNKLPLQDRLRSKKNVSTINSYPRNQKPHNNP